MKLNLLSWNVNGIRSVSGKGFFEWMKDQSADVVCIQETKADQIGRASCRERV